ncbi:MAG: glycosyltransferase family 4 protein [Candidatus Hodarchaeales archaeon]
MIAASLNIFGGQAVQANTIVEGFGKEGLEINYIPINPKLNGIWGFCQRYKYMRTIVTSAAYIKNLIKKIPEYDVLHIFSASYFSFLIAPTPAVLIGKYYNKKVILNYHSGEAEDHLLRSEATIKWILKHVDTVAVPSVYLQHVFCKFGINTRVIYNVVDEDEFPFRKRETFKPVFIVARNLEPLYNVQCVLKAFRLIQDKFPEACLIILGSGSEERFLKSLSRNLKLKNVIFTGKVARDIIGKYYEKADFMLNASNIDNMPVSILEAFSSGIPVISTEAGGIPYTIRNGENGFLVPLNDERFMAEKAIYLLENQGAARRIAEKAFDDFKTHYTWRANRQKWLDLYGIK